MKKNQQNRRLPVKPQAAGAERVQGKTLLFGLLLFLLLSLSYSDSAKVTALIAIACGVGLTLWRYKTVKARFSRTALLLLLYVLLLTVSAFRAPWGKFALTEGIKYLAAFAAFLTVLALEPGQKERTGVRTAAVLQFCAAAASFLSIDLTAAKLLSAAVAKCFASVCPFYEDLSFGNYVRIASFWQNVNVFSAVAGLGILLGLGSLRGAQTKGQRRLTLCCLCINSVAFVTAFSRGAMALLAVSFLVYLLLEYRDRRGAALTVMAETLLCAGLPSVVCFAVSFGEKTGTRFVPVLVTLLGAALLVLCDELIGVRLAEKLREQGKKIAVCIAALPLLCAAALLLILNLTGPARVAGEQTIYRAARPAAGENELSVTADGEVLAEISCIDEVGAFAGAEVLYEGPADGAVFTMPETVKVIFFRFSSPEGATITEAHYSGARDGTIRLGYRLLPEGLAGFVQGALQTEDFIKRRVFWKDGLTLWKTEPLLGLGLGAFENQASRIQTYHYESQYVHNHYVQALVDTGILGLLLFAGILISCAWALWNARRRGSRNPLLPCLGAALLFAASQAFVDVIFSSSFYLAAGFALFGLITICGEDTLPEKQFSAVGTAVSAAATALWCVLLVLNLYAKSLTKEPTYDDLVTAARIDRFERNDYRLSYAYYACTDEACTEEMRVRLYEYLEALEKVESNTGPYYVAYCYFQLGEEEKAFASLRKYNAYTVSNGEKWDKAFRLAAGFDSGSQEYTEGLTALYGDLQQWNASAPIPITPEEDVEDWLRSRLALDD